MEFLSKEAISKIREAEDKARIIIESAEVEAGKRIDAAEKAGAALYEKMTASAAEDLKDRLSKVTGKSKELVEESRRDAEGELEELEAQARENMRDAVKLVVWGIFDLCQ